MSEAAALAVVPPDRVSEAEAARRRRVAAANLSTLEVEIVLWISKGKSSLDVAQLMGLGTAWTVEKRVTKILGKTGTPSRAALVAWALRNKVIE